MAARGTFAMEGVIPDGKKSVSIGSHPSFEVATYTDDAVTKTINCDSRMCSSDEATVEAERPGLPTPSAYSGYEETKKA